MDFSVQRFTLNSANSYNAMDFSAVISQFFITDRLLPTVLSHVFLQEPKRLSVWSDLVVGLGPAIRDILRRAEIKHHATKSLTTCIIL